MTHKTNFESDTRPAGERVGENGRVEQELPERGELKITQDLVPTGLGLMPRRMARRIAELFSPGASGHA
jgi:hypothetical protein